MIILGAIIAYFLFMIIIGIKAGRSETHEGFVIGSRNVGYIPTIGSLASSFRDGMGVIFWFGFGATVGYGGIWLFFGVIAGLFVYTFIGPHIRATAKENDYVTVGEMLRDRMGIITERLSGLVILTFAMMYIAVQLYVSGHLFAEVLQMSPSIGVWTVAFVVGFYLFFGGYSTVVKTDGVQFFLILSLLIVPFFFTPRTEDLTNFSTFFTLGITDIVALNIIGFLFTISTADAWQRLFSARDDKVIRYGFPVAGIFLIIMTLSLIFMGMAAKPYLGDAIGADDAFYQIFKGDYIPTFLLAYIAVIVMAICMSTLDTFCYLSAATLAKNFFPPALTEKRNSYIYFSQIVMVLILITMSVLALTLTDVILFVFNAASLLFVMAPVYIYAALGYPKKKEQETDAMIAISVFFGIIIYLYLFSEGALDKMIMTLVPVIVSFILTTLSIFLAPRIPVKDKSKTKNA